MYVSSLSPMEILARDKEGFPPKSSVTFGEVVSSFNKYGNVASKRHGGVHISKEMHIPNRWSTIRDNTVQLEQNGRDRLSPSPSMSRPLNSARSRSSSPWASRRPRSVPPTPMTPGRLRESRKENWSDLGDKLTDAYGFEAGHGRLIEPMAGVGGGSFSRGGHLGYSYCNGVTSAALGESGGGTGGSSTARHGSSKAKLGMTCAPCGNVHTADANFCRQCGTKRELQADCATSTPRSPAMTRSASAKLREPSWDAATAVAANQLPLRPPPLWTHGAANRDLDSRDSWSRDYLQAAPSSNPRVASFVRLNGFLIRTHITSLISALAEDGWLEAWEKEKLCGLARESDSSNPWAQTFLRIYMRFMETDDVATFVAALKAQISP